MSNAIQVVCSQTICDGETWFCPKHLFWKEYCSALTPIINFSISNTSFDFAVSMENQICVGGKRENQGLTSARTLSQGSQMVPNLANIPKNHCFPKSLPTFLEIFFCQKFAIFWNTDCQYWQNNPFWIIYQMHIANFREKIQLNINRCELSLRSLFNFPEACS